MIQPNNKQPLASWKPNKFVFVYWYLLTRYLIINLILVSVSFIMIWSYPFWVIMILIIFALIEIIILINNLIRYKKEEYHLYADRLIQHGGSIFSDYQTELVIKNITYVDITVPFIENFFFGTANVRIESAGSASSEIFLKSIDNYSFIEQKIKEAMKQNGFSLQKKNLLQNEHPSNTGIIIRLIGEIFALIFSSSWILGIFVAYLYIVSAKKFIFFGFIFLLLIFIINILILLFRYLDLRRRTYQIFDDTIVYTEGFLTRHYSFIPIENLANSAVEQNLVFRLLGIYNIKLSCQGSGQEIVFQYMRNGQQMEKTIDNLISTKLQINQATTVVNTKSSTTSMQVSKTEGQVVEPIKQITKTDFTGKYKRFWGSVLVYSIILMPVVLVLLVMNAILGIFLFGSIVTLVISVFATTYSVSKDSIQENYTFFSTKEKKFSVDKITGLVISENIIDWIFGTYTIKFWSIGSDASIKFKSIKKSPDLVPEMLKKFGIINQPPIYTIPAKLSIIKYLAGNIALFLTLMLLMGGSMFSILYVDIRVFIVILLSEFFLSVLYVISMYIWFVFRYANAEIKIFSNYVTATKGFFFKDQYYSLLDNIKDIETMQYPLTNVGSIKFNIAGEELVQKGKNNQGMLFSNHFTMEFVDGIVDLDEIVDLILRVRPADKSTMQKIVENLPLMKSKENILLYTRPSLMNTLFIFVVIPPLWFFIPLITWYMLKISYQVESFRVVKRWGLIYKSQKSLVFEKIDFIDKKQGFLNKLFGNGSVSLNTVGSSKTELEINNVKDYELVYSIVKERYK